MKHSLTLAGLLSYCPLACAFVVCESCQYCAALAHESLAGARDVDALVSTALARVLTHTAPESLAEEDVKKRCQRYFAADRHILQKFVQQTEKHSVASAQSVVEALCFQRLRCPAGDPWTDEAPTALSNYEDMLATHRQAAGSWPPGPKQSSIKEGALKTSDTEACINAEKLAEQDVATARFDDPLNPKCLTRSDSYRDLSSTRVEVVVFTGRRDRLRILLRYLRRDLRLAGGVVDKVIFALWQVTQRDVSFIQEQVKRTPEAFEVRDFTEEKLGADRMVQLYQSLNESETVYVKVDDDVVYIAEHAIANLVRERLRERCLLVSANVVNHAIMSALHQDRGAHRGFWPPAEQRRNPSMRLPWKKMSEINMSPEFTIERFPASRCVVERWDCAALVHKSFLDRVRDNTLCTFDFGWHDFNRAGYREHKYIHRSPSIGKEYWSEGARWSTNFFVFRPSDLAGVNWENVHGKGDDEEEFTGPHAERRDQHSCAVGSALVVHFSYGSQEQGLMSYTDLLKRYDKLSRRVENVSVRIRVA